jgi:hypothetical protein
MMMKSVAWDWDKRAENGRLQEPAQEVYCLTRLFTPRGDCGPGGRPIRRAPTTQR